MLMFIFKLKDICVSVSDFVSKYMCIFSNLKAPIKTAFVVNFLFFIFAKWNLFARMLSNKA